MRVARKCPSVTFCLASFATGGFCQVPASADDLAGAKAIFLSQTPGSAQRQAARFFAVLPSTGRRVSALHRFYSGDTMKFQFELKRDAFVYVLNSTIPFQDAEGQSDGTKGIVRISPENNRPLVPVAPWRLLLPADWGAPLRVPAGLTTNAAGFQMDAEPGWELVTVIVSPYALDITAVMFGGSGGDDSRESALANAAIGGLAAWRANCALSLAPDAALVPSGTGEPESYAVARVSGRPFAFQVAFRHLERNK